MKRIVEAEKIQLEEDKKKLEQEKGELEEQLIAKDQRLEKELLDTSKVDELVSQLKVVEE